MMNAKILGLVAAGLLAGPVAANAATSGCFFGLDEMYECDLYESGGTTTLQLDVFVGEGTAGIFDAQAGSYRDVLSFVDGDLGTLLTFSFGTLPAAPYGIDRPRTGSLTTWVAGRLNVYRIHHDGDVAVPEPGSLALLGLGLVGLGLARRRKNG